jgi:hypothetical protein
MYKKAEASFWTAEEVDLSKVTDTVISGYAWLVIKTSGYGS